MLSVTSYSNPAETAGGTQKAPRSVNGLIHPGLLRKNLTRFWPLWAVYALIFLLVWPVAQFISTFGRGGFYSERYSVVEYLATEMLSMSPELGLWLGLFAGLFFALAMFSYLCNGRALSMFHSFPVRRETLFFTNYLSGLLCFVVPLAVSALLAGLVQMSAGGADWYAVSMSFLLVAGQTFFFYSFAVFCVMFSGQVLAIPVFYGILNGLVFAMYFLVQAFAGAFYFGYNGSSSSNWVYWLTPVAKLQSDLSVSGGIWSMDAANNIPPLSVNGMGVLGVYVLAAVVLTALSLVIYKLRRSEAAGDIVVLDWAKQLFRYGVGVCAALSLGQGLYYLVWAAFFATDRVSFPAMLACLLLTGVLGIYAAEMLIRKSFRVLRKGRRGAACLMGGLLLFALAVNFDVLGVENRIPDADQVESVQFNVGGRGYSNSSLTDAEGIAMIQEVQRAILAEKESFLEREEQSRTAVLSADSDNCYIRVEYSLKNGSILDRSYSLNYTLEELEGGSPAMALLKETISSPKMQHANLDIPSLERFTSGELELYEPDSSNGNGWRSKFVSFSETQAQELYDAIQRDIDAGNFGRNDLDSLRWSQETYANSITFSYIRTPSPENVFYNQDARSDYSIHFSSNAVNLLETLRRLELLNGSEGLVSQGTMDQGYFNEGEVWAEMVNDVELPAAQYEATSTAVLG